jgi:hypothetical protein
MGRRTFILVGCSILLVACSHRTEREPARAGASRLAQANVPGFSAPVCLQEAPGCSSGVLLAGPDGAGAELNAPNTLDTAGCPDRPDAGFAVQGLAVSTPQGATMEAGRPIDVEATVSIPPGEVGVVQLWYTASAWWPPAGLQWRPIPLGDPYVYPTAPGRAIRARIWAEQAGIYAVRASVGPPTANGCDAMVDTDDLAFVVAPIPSGTSLVLSPEDGTFVTGLVRLALQQPDFSLCQVEYAIDELRQVVVSTEPPFFPFVVDSTAAAPVAGPGGSLTVHAEAFRVGSDAGCNDAGPLDQLSLRVSAAATCDPTWGRPTCSAPSAACGSARLVEGERDWHEPVCGGRSIEPTGPTIERLIVRSRDGQPLEPGVPARAEVDLGGVPSPSRVDVTFLSLEADGTSFVLGVAENVGDAVERGGRIGIDFVVAPIPDMGDPARLRQVMAVIASGGVATDETLAFAAPDLTAPAVALEAPRAGAVVTNPVTLRAIARDAGGLAHVSFRAGEQVVGDAFQPPFQLSVSLPEGALSLTAEAWDRTGNSALSSAVSVTVDATPPVAIWRAPGAGATAHGTVTLSLYAVDPDATAARAAERVEIWDGERLLATLTAPTEWEPSGWPRWDLAWDTTAVESGPHTLRAVAIDRVGLRSEADLPVLVDQPPALTLVRPVDGEQAVGSITFAADVGDDLGDTRLELLVDGWAVTELIVPATGPGPAPLAALALAQTTRVEYVWTPMSLLPGDHVAGARACDRIGQCVERTALVHVPDVIAPTVAVTSPAAGAVLDGPVVLEAKAWDDVGVVRVEYYANGSYRGSATVPPYPLAFDPAPWQGRTVTLVALAFDAAGNQGVSAPVAVGVRDTTPPIVALTSPTEGAVLFKTATLTASASDNAGVTQVRFLLDGAVVGTDEGPPYAVTLDVRKVARGLHLVAAVAIDAAGNMGTSAPTAVYVK